MRSAALIFLLLAATVVPGPGPGHACGGADDAPAATTGTDGAELNARFELSLLAAPDEPGFRRPGAVSTDLFGNVFVADTGNHRVVHFDPAGRLVFTFGGYGWDEGELSGPTDVCAREGFRLFVVDAGNDRVQQFDIGDSSPEGVVFPFQTGSGFAGEELVRPYRMDVGDEGRIYICDSLCHCVWVFAPTGELIDRLGGLGGEPTRMRDPGGVAIGPQGRVYVADTGNRRIQVFDLLGNWLAAWGGDDTELLVEPTGIDVGPGGNVFVADAGASRVVVLTSAGVPLFRFGGPGDGPGTFRAPVDVAVTADGRVYVVDEVRQVVERFRILRDAHPRQ